MVSRLTAPPDAGQLQQNRLFAGIPAELITGLGADVDLFRFDAEDIIFREGDSADGLYLVVEGAVRISKVGRGSQQETLGHIMPGNFFGEMALIDGEPRSAQATASTPSVLGRIDTESFAHMLQAAPRDLHMNFLRSFAERLRGIDSHFIVELMRTERLSLVGTMANSIIHDLKNPLTVLQSCTELIVAKTSDPAITDLGALMGKAVGNVFDMLEELLDYARGQSSLQPARHSPKAVLDELDAQLVRLLPQNVHLVREFRPCDEIKVDLGRFVRVLLNLIKNSLEAMPKGGLLRLGLRQEGGWIIFRVGDTGCGISPELQAKIFEPFVTYGKSKGTGLGMAIAKSVVEAHHGNIQVKSTVGTGTTIEVRLPALPPEGGV